MNRLCRAPDFPETLAAFARAYYYFIYGILARGTSALRYLRNNSIVTAVFATFVVTVVPFFASPGPSAADGITPPRERVYRHAGACTLLIIDSQNAEPYTSFRRAMLSHLEAHGCGGEHGPEVRQYSVGNRAGLARRIWQSETPEQYDAVVVQGTVAAQEIYSLSGDTSDQPVFYGNVTDPTGIGLIDDFNEPPSSNFTGVSYPVDIAERIRFVRRIVPEARTFGLVHTTMPQSRSYSRRLRRVLESREFDGISLLTREVPYVPGENGVQRSVLLAREHIRDLDPRVDVFLSPNDQMGVSRDFVQAVTQTARSPLIGNDRYTVGRQGGAVAALYPSTEEAGRTLADMILRFLNGADWASLHARKPESRVAIDHTMLLRYGLEAPEDLLN